jgi:pimeloyl-ACP methyl ester carboxylesterase
MELPDRARSVLDYLVNFGLGQRPIIFITHSLGGLLVKAMLRAANDSKTLNWKRLLVSTRGIVFLGTPHTGASQGSLAELQKRAFGVSVNTAQLASNDAHLRDLATWYSNNSTRLRIKSLAYYEKGTVKGITVVDAASANPNVEDCEPVPSDANHINICKPKSNTDPVYLGALRFVEKFTGEPNAARGSVTDTSYTVDNVFGIHRGDTCN